MRMKTTGQLAHIPNLTPTPIQTPEVPASGLAAALGVMILAYCDEYIPRYPLPVITYRKHRHFDPVDAFIGEHQANDVWPTLAH